MKNKNLQDIILSLSNNESEKNIKGLRREMVRVQIR